MIWEIIAGMSTGETITPCRKTLIALVETNYLKKWVSKQEVDFMVACDMGLKWKALAACPVLFCIDDNGGSGYVTGTGKGVSYLPPEKAITGGEKNV